MIVEEAVSAAGFGFFPYVWGVECVRAVQAFGGPAFVVFMKLVTSIVSEGVFFAVIMVLFWLVDERKAFRLGILLIISSWCNAVLKTLFNQPRPFHFDPALGLLHESSNGFPSNHSQLIVVLLVPLAVWFCRRNRSKTAVTASITVTALLILLVSFSRLYLGVHFPQDILGGWLAAACVLLVFFLLESKLFDPAVPASSPQNRAVRFFAPLRTRLVLAALASFIMNALHPADKIYGALLLGFGCAYALTRAFIPFTARCPNPAAAVLRLVCGFAGVVILYFTLKFVFPSQPSPWYGLFRFIRYTLAAFWAGGGAPWVFTRLESRFQTFKQR